MMREMEIPLSNCKKVVVNITVKSNERKYSVECYDDGNGAIKEEDGFLWLRRIRVLAAHSKNSGTIRLEWNRDQLLKKVKYTIDESSG
jgi:hypothetical protein